MTDITYEFDGGFITEDTLRDLADYEDRCITPAFEEDRQLRSAATLLPPGYTDRGYAFTFAIDQTLQAEDALGLDHETGKVLWAAVSLWRFTGPAAPGYQHKALRDALKRLNAVRGAAAQSA